jgi:hypothetical protein
MVTLNSVQSITRIADPTALMVACNITDDNGVTMDVMHVYRENDPFGEISPLIGQWMADNPDFPIGDYVPPTLEEMRQAAPPLERLFFRTRAKEAGLTTTKVNAYIASIADPSEQEDMQMFWDDAQFFGRLDKFVVDAGAHAGLTEAQLDAIFYINA